MPKPTKAELHDALVGLIWTMERDLMWADEQPYRLLVMRALVRAKDAVGTTKVGDRLALDAIESAGTEAEYQRRLDEVAKILLTTTPDKEP